jgi:dihydroorotate dehydrogenase
MPCYVSGQKSVVLKVNFYRMIRGLLFCLPAEFSHHLALNTLKILDKLHLLTLFISSIEQPVGVFGLEFKNPLGIAAGLDKNADYIDMLFALGFGFVEVGTVTPKPQPGNAKPRLFRIPKKNSLINRMGFNNKGVDYLVKRLQQRKSKGIVGVNIGKNKHTPIERAVDDYLYCLKRVYSVADYIVINISSPNTADLRQLQHHSTLDAFINQIMQCCHELAEHYHKKKPLLVKLSPDAAEFQLDKTLAIFERHGVAGVIATNTSTTREGVEGLKHCNEQGGLSGAPIAAKSNVIIHEIAKLRNAELPIIGVGGIMDAESASNKFKSGADLIQLYSGFIYQGPACIRSILLNINR